jgi:two-component system OmpR family sensor kinase
VIGREYAAAVGHKLDALMPPLAQLDDLFSRADGLPVEVRHEVRERTMILEVSRSTIVSREEERLGQVILLREITERKEAEHRNLEVALERERIQLLARFIRSTSHDLRTPLAIMNTSIYVARRTADPAQREEKLALIEQQVKVMTRMIDDLHLLAKLESDVPLAATPIRLIDLVHNIPDDVRAMIRSKSLTLQVSGDDSLTVRAQPDLLLRAYHNLLHNGVVYTPREGNVKVRAYADEQARAVIEVADTGQGIAAEQLEHIFDGFHKANTARTSDGTGMGIGLPIARKIATAHHGRLEVSSTPGEGSVFKLVLPIDNTEARLTL